MDWKNSDDSVIVLFCFGVFSSIVGNVIKCNQYFIVSYSFVVHSH